jgi:flavin reductase (DIM6/NTAB) family NADH-FMN oxidoreductase RutF
MLAISIGPRTGGESYPKDTLTNIRDRQEFVINIVSMPLANAMHESSINYPPEIDEFERAGVTPARSEAIAVPRVEEAKINMECTLDRIIELGSDHLVIGRMQRYHVQDDLFHNGRIDTLKLDPLARLAGDFSRIETVFNLPLDEQNPKK